MPPANLAPTVRYAGLPLLDPESPAPGRSPASPELIGRCQRRRTFLVGSLPARHSDSGSVPTSSLNPPQPRSGKKRRWRPWRLSVSVMVLNIFILVAMAVTLEVLLKVNRDAYGWETPSFYNKFPQIHIVWTVLPGLIAFLFVQQWFEVDRYIKLLQPYIDMSRGQVPAEKSVLLDYQGRSKWLVWTEMLQNKHVTPLLTNSLAILAIIVPSLSSSYLYLQQPPNNFTQPLSNITVLDQLGLYSAVPYSFTDAAAGFIKASSLYSVSAPPFIRFLPGAAWSATRVAVYQIPQAGTVKVHCVCLKSLVSCQGVDSPSYSAVDQTVSGSTSNCSFTSPRLYSDTNNSSVLRFGMSPATCSLSGVPNTTETSAVAFWIMEGYSPVATVCTPKMTLQRADALLNSTTSALILINNQTPLLGRDQEGIDTKSAPFNGSAYNGLFFSLVNDEVTIAGINSTHDSLGQAIATLYSSNTTNTSRTEKLRSVATDAYAHYLGLVAPSLYFRSATNATTSGLLHLFNERLFVSPLITHALFVVLLMMAIIGACVTVLYHRAARNLVLTAEPGTLAAAVALAGLSVIAHILDGKDTEEEMRAMLVDLHFTIDPNTGRLRVEESEQGYSEIPSSLPSRAPVPQGSELQASASSTTHLYTPEVTEMGRLQRNTIFGN